MFLDKKESMDFLDDEYYSIYVVAINDDFYHNLGPIIDSVTPSMESHLVAGSHALCWDGKRVLPLCCARDVWVLILGLGK